MNTQATLTTVLQKNFPWCSAWKAELKGLFGAYVEAKQAQNVLDYDDLLLLWAEMVTEPILAAELGARFDHLMVDEYQETNRLQAAILLGMKPDGRGVTVVGDDAQSIYAVQSRPNASGFNCPHYRLPVNCQVWLAARRNTPGLSVKVWVSYGLTRGHAVPR